MKKEATEVTFKPKINWKELVGPTKQSDRETPVSFDERNKMWLERWQKKIQKQVDEKWEDGIEECTFAPKLATWKPKWQNYAPSSSASTSKYV